MRLDRDKVRDQMQRAGIATLGELAERVGVAPETMSRFFAGAIAPSFDTLDRMCSTMQCTVDDLVTYPKAPALTS